MQILTTLSNWKDEEKGGNIGESFTWNNRKQYIQGVNLKKISYGIVYGIYYGYNQDRRKETRFEDDHTAMQLIRKLYNVSEDKDWDNLVPTAVLWTLEEQQQQKYLNQLSSQETAKNKKLQQTNADLQQTILEQQKTILEQQKTILEQEQTNNELTSLKQEEKMKFEQDIANLKEAINEVNLSKNNQDKFEISEINQQYETEVNKLNFKLKID